MNKVAEKKITTAKRDTSLDNISGYVFLSKWSANKPSTDHTNGVIKI